MEQSRRCWSRRLRGWLRGPAPTRQPQPGRVEHDAVVQAYWLVRAFYLIVLHFAFETQRNLQRLAASDRQIDPLWPVGWVDQASFAAAANVIGLGFLVSAVVAVVWTDRRVPRILVALFYVQTLAFENSFGSINHYGHFGLWLCLCFAALPGARLERLRGARAPRRSYLTVFFLAQSLIALFYTSSGARKAYYGLFVPENAVSSFAPEALPLLVVQKWLQIGEAPLLADLFIQHLWLAWPAHLLVIYVELFALVAVFRPELHRLWGVLLIVFHLLVWLLLGVSFAFQPALLGLLFVFSPFAPRPQPRVAQTFRQLPMLGDLAALAGHDVASVVRKA